MRRSTKLAVAYHEAGHAVADYYHLRKIRKVTIAPEHAVREQSIVGYSAVMAEITSTESMSKSLPRNSGGYLKRSYRYSPEAKLKGASTAEASEIGRPRPITKRL